MNFLQTFGLVLAGAFISGASAGLLGVFAVGLRIPFIAVTVAHAALAGAVFGSLAGVSPFAGALGGSILGALLLSRMLQSRHTDPGGALSVLFSLTMGLAFLGIQRGSGPQTESLGLLWGSLLFITPAQLGWIAVCAVGLLLFTLLLYRPLCVLLFSRQLAAAMLPEPLLFTALLMVMACVTAVNLQAVGGLMLYSLICNPALAALKLSRSGRQAFVLSAVLGAVSAVGGFLCAWRFDLPAGACMVLVSAAVAAPALLCSGFRTPASKVAR